ncbi:serine/threonine protein kinase [Streptomyces tendae]|uniref:protein kinase domain-containing protein n=1 Tax=Streptomyces tendae TaxID=1932 RepID=UPI0038351CBC
MDGLIPDDPERIGRYRLLGRLGEGGMGRVYLARSDRGRTVAVKTVREELARMPDFRRRFAQEVKAAQRVGGEWTAPVLDADTEAATPWVATGYVAGPSLAEVVDRQYGPLPSPTLRVLAAGLVRALQTIHGAGLVHRDLKPSNVLVTIDGPRVIDFGIARALDASTQSAEGLTKAGAVVGSPGFMSPEQVRGEKVSYASDVFCLGAVLAYAATGRMPFGTDEGGLHSLLFRIATEEADLTGVPEPWQGVVSACLAKEPEKRPTPEELLTSIEVTAGADDTPGGAWLPGEVLAELGRHAVQLLDSEDPEDRAPVGAAPAAAPAAGFGPPPAAYGPATPPWQGRSPLEAGPGAVARPSPYSTPAPAAAPVTPSPYAPPPARRAKGLATALNVLLILFVVPVLFEFNVLMAVYSELGGRPGSSSPRGIDDFRALQVTGFVAEGLSLLVLLAAATVWVCWFRRMRQNAESFAPGRIRYRPGLAVGSWFIPVVNFFMPKQIANDIWTATTGRPAGAGRWLMHTWWWLWVLHLATELSAYRTWDEEKTADDAMGTVISALGGDVVAVVSTVFAVLFVSRLTRLQGDRAAGDGRAAGSR